MARLLVTAGQGFIGTNFVHYWLDTHPGEPVVVYDVLTYSGNPANLRPSRRASSSVSCGATFWIRPMLNPCCAGKDRHDRALRCRIARRSLDTGPDAFVQTNAVGTHSLLKGGAPAVAARRNCQRASVSSYLNRRVYGR